VIDTGNHGDPIDINYRRVSPAIRQAPKLSKLAITSVVLCGMQIPFVCGGGAAMFSGVYRYWHSQVPVTIQNGSLYVMPTIAVICAASAWILITRKASRLTGRLVASIGFALGILWLAIIYLLSMVHIH